MNIYYENYYTRCATQSDAKDFHDLKKSNLESQLLIVYLPIGY